MPRQRRIVGARGLACEEQARQRREEVFVGAYPPDGGCARRKASGADMSYTEMRLSLWRSCYVSSAR